MKDGSRAERLQALALLVIITGYLVHAWRLDARLQDDAFVSFRYARNLVEGNGLVWNLGERVEGYTNFLWTLLMAIPFVGSRDADPVRFARFLATFAGAITIALSYLLARRIAPASRVAAFVPPLLLAGSWAFAVNSMTGLETTAFAALVTLATLLACREDGPGRSAWIAYGLAALMRPEAIGLAILVAAVTLAPRQGAPRRARLVSMAPFAILVGAHLAFRLAYYGALVPNTYVVKAFGDLPAGMPTRATYLTGFVTKAMDLFGVFSALALLFIVTRVRDRAARPVIVGIAFAPIVVLVSGADFMVGYRFLVPYLPLIYVGAAAGSVALAERWRRRYRESSGIELELGLVIISLFAGAKSVQHSFEVLRPFEQLRERVGRDGNHVVGDLLGERLAPGSKVLAIDIGEIGFRSRLPIVDLSGLTDKAIARRPGDVLDRDLDLDDVFGRDPKAIVLIAEWISKWTPSSKGANPYFPPRSARAIRSDPRFAEFELAGRYPPYGQLTRLDDGALRPSEAGDAARAKEDIRYILEVWIKRDRP